MNITRIRYSVRMCGIAGIIGREASAEAALAMSARIAHRGPDGDGIWEADGVALAHRRLAILDPTPAGAQPMQFGALIPALQTRNIDAIVSQLFIKPERQKVIDFSDPYYQSGLKNRSPSDAPV